MRRAWLLIVLLAGLAGSASCRSEPDAEQALKDLKSLLAEFVFVDGPSKSVALSGMITPV